MVVALVLGLVLSVAVGVAVPAVRVLGSESPEETRARDRDNFQRALTVFNTDPQSQAVAELASIAARSDGWATESADCGVNYSAGDSEVYLVTLAYPTGFWVQALVDPVSGVESEELRFGRDSFAELDASTVFAPTAWPCRLREGRLELAP